MQGVRRQGDLEKTRRGGATAHGKGCSDEPAAVAGFGAREENHVDYKPGWTDARIAKEAGLSEVFVAQRRAADYGPISPPKPPILQNASNAVGHMATAIRDIAASAGALQTKSEALIKTAERLLADLAEAQKSKCAA